MANHKLLIEDLEYIRTKIVNRKDSCWSGDASVDINALNDAIDILKRIVIVRGAQQFPLEDHIPFDDMDEIARHSITRSFASFIETDKLYTMNSELRRMPGTCLDTVYYEGDLMVIRPK